MPVDLNETSTTEGVYTVREIQPVPNARKPILWRVELFASNGRRIVFLYDTEVALQGGLPRLGSIIWARLHSFRVQGDRKTHLQCHQCLS